MTYRDSRCQTVKQIREKYPTGTRILLIQMGDDPNPIKSNTRGTVTNVDDLGTIHCYFDNGRLLGVLIGIDEFRKLTESELKEETL